MNHARTLSHVASPGSGCGSRHRSGRPSEASRRSGLARRLAPPAGRGGSSPTWERLSGHGAPGLRTLWGERDRSPERAEARWAGASVRASTHPDLSRRGTLPAASSTGAAHHTRSPPASAHVLNQRPGRNFLSASPTWPAAWLTVSDAWPAASLATPAVLPAADWSSFVACPATTLSAAPAC